MDPSRDHRISVHEDQALQLPHHFYFPSGMPGLDEEGVGKLTELQFIPEQNIFAKKNMCDAEKMQLPFCLTKEAYQSVIGHMANFFRISKFLEKQKNGTTSLSS